MLILVINNEYDIIINFDQLEHTSESGHPGIPRINFTTFPLSQGAFKAAKFSDLVSMAFHFDIGWKWFILLDNKQIQQFSKALHYQEH